MFWLTLQSLCHCCLSLFDCECAAICEISSFLSQIPSFFHPIILPQFYHSFPLPLFFWPYFDHFPHFPMILPAKLWCTGTILCPIQNWSKRIVGARHRWPPMPRRCTGTSGPVEWTTKCPGHGPSRQPGQGNSNWVLFRIIRFKIRKELEKRNLVLRDFPGLGVVEFEGI